jgi:glyoxylase-like metal-dependent hydrolase (beta-lactamase superfamily II)/ferredoxin
MARLSERLRGNVAGEFYVDQSCIDCDTCRQLAPETYVRDDREGMSVVRHQPEAGADRERALMALVACPTASIGTLHKHDVRAAARRFPEPIADHIYYCGFASPDSYGASSYLIRRERGNVLVDSPRATRLLCDRIEALGGVRWLFLTHRDDVADHEQLRARFGCERVMHRDDAPRGIERLIDGRDPVRLDDDLLLIPVPGHTRGSAALLHREFLFTGDHLWAEDDGRLGASRSVCWYSWDEQIRSMDRLSAFDFTQVLPGHGRRFGAHSPLAMRHELARLIGVMRDRSRW